MDKNLNFLFWNQGGMDNWDLWCDLFGLDNIINLVNTINEVN